MDKKQVDQYVKQDIEAVEELYTRNKLEVSDSIMLGVDITKDGGAVISVARHDGTKMIYIKTIVGLDARYLYDKLTTDDSWKEKSNENVK